MRNPQPLFVCCCFGVFAVTICITVDAYSCVTAYWDTVSCALRVAGNASNTTYGMKFTRLLPSRNEIFSCPLVWMNHSYRCDCKVTVNAGTFSSATKYNINLCSDSKNCSSLTERFFPSRHIQLTTPSGVQVQQTPGAFNFTWTSGYEGHRYFSSYLDYELFLEAFESKGSKSFNHTLRCQKPNKSVALPRSDLKSYTKYCIKVRSFVDYHGGFWSKWGNQTCWENDATQKEILSENSFKQESEQTPAILAKVLAPVCVGFVILLFVFYRPAARMRIKSLSHTPSPAPFFQPLFQQYEGNLQDWLSPQHTCSIIYKTEETLTTDAVVVVPKPMKKDPEENLDFHEPSVTLPISQCPTAYVGLPGMHKASCPVTMVCPGNMSYTQLPCSVWEFNVEEIQAMPSSPRDSLENSCSDSGCSFESVTESPDCSLPTSPAVEISPPFNCSDY